MAKKKTIPRRKHVPLRTCVGCREVLPKRSLTRIVRTSEGVIIDPGGKIAGRGAYVHDRRACWDRALKGALAQALRSELTDEDKNIIVAFIANLPDSEPVVED